VGDKLDVAIRIGHLPSSTLMARKLADSRRTFVAAPSYLEENGAPRHPQELLNHNCLLLRFPGSTQFQWQYAEDGVLKTLAVEGRFDSDNGDVLRQWALAGEGIALAHRWEVNEDIQAGRLIPILLGTPPMPVPISAVYAQGSLMPSRSRLFIDFLSNLFKDGIPD
jgi:DNA-binding transcriptional LysR family regulator